MSYFYPQIFPSQFCTPCHSPCEKAPLEEKCGPGEMDALTLRVFVGLMQEPFGSQYLHRQSTTALTSDPGHLTRSSGLHRHLNIHCIHSPRYIHTYVHINTVVIHSHRHAYTYICTYKHKRHALKHIYIHTYTYKHSNTLIQIYTPI